MLPFPVQYDAYTPAHVLTQLQLLLFSGLAFFLLLGFLKRTPTISLDFDWFWRVLSPAVGQRVGSIASTLQKRLGGTLAGIVPHLAAGIERGRAPNGLLVRTSPTSSMTIWVMVMLLGYLALYYLEVN